VKHMNIIFEKETPQATDEAIAAFEDKTGLKLPDSYCNFLREFNGGYPEEGLFEFNDDHGPNSSTVRSFLSLGEASDSLENYLETYFGRLPANALPIAYDDGGNLICLFFGDGQTEPPVVFWDHESENEDDETTVFFLIAENFESFCRELKPY